ncbi:hypothetical protein [Burkholderia stagnalis]
MKILTARPQRAFYVRKRWDGDGVYLIHLTAIIRIEKFEEAVWDRLDGESELGEVMAGLSSLFSDISPFVLDALVARCIIRFAEYGFLQDE